MISPLTIGVFLAKKRTSPRYMLGSIEPEITTTIGLAVQSVNFITFQIMTADMMIMPNWRA